MAARTLRHCGSSMALAACRLQRARALSSATGSCISATVLRAVGGGACEHAPVIAAEAIRNGITRDGRTRFSIDMYSPRSGPDRASNMGFMLMNRKACENPQRVTTITFVAPSMCDRQQFWSLTRQLARRDDGAMRNGTATTGSYVELAISG